MGLIRSVQPGETLDSLPSAGERAARKQRSASVADTVRFSTGKEELELPVVVGSENERGIDISNLRAKTGLVTLDPAFMNTASTESAIPFLDGEKGILRYRGRPSGPPPRGEGGEKSSLSEPASLLIEGPLPRKEEMEKGDPLPPRHSMIHE